MNTGPLLTLSNEEIQRAYAMAAGPKMPIPWRERLGLAPDARLNITKHYVWVTDSFGVRRLGTLPYRDA